MKRPPLWKIRRELARAGRKTLRAPRKLWGILVHRRYYDRVLAPQIKRTEGEVHQGPEAGIYLIYPSHGVLPSHLHSLREMVGAGISPIVVSNLPLGEDDKARLLPLSARILERPNAGYDFGGYRDGIIELEDRLPELDRLWLLNDSAWMVPQAQSWFDAARALDTDFAAATSNFAMPRVDPDEYRDITWTFRTTHRNFHYASYALSIRAPVLRDREFLEFWRKLHISNDKTETVRRGEIGFSQWVLKHGYSHSATCEVDQLDKELEALPDPELDRVARELVIPVESRLKAVRDEILRLDPSSDEGRISRRCLILTATSRFASAYALPGYTLPHRGFQFLKKSPMWLTPESATMMLELISRIDGEAGDMIAREARALMHG